MRRRVRFHLGLAAWALIVSVGYLVIATADRGLAESMVVAYFVLLVGPPAVVETREVLRDE